MTFEGQYLTYLEYKDLIEGEGGSAMAEMPFNLLEFECRRKIDIRTQNRLVNLEESEIPDEVKLCEFLMINKISSYNETVSQTGNNMIKSENIDGYSVSYVTGNEALEVTKNKEQELENIMEDILMNVIVNNEHIMYLGVN